MSDGKRKKNFYSPQDKRKFNSRKVTLDTGMKGFLCSCNFCEKNCVMEAYRILNEYFEKEMNLEAHEDSGVDVKSDETKIVDNQINEIKKDEEKDKEEEEEEDISTLLHKEISSLKSQYTKLFQSVNSGIKNFVFIQTSLPDPLKLVFQIMKDAYETKKLNTRFILRMLPIELVCKAFIDVIVTKADPLFDKYFVQEPKTFAIVINRHSNNSIERNVIIEKLADMITKKNPGNKVDLKTPELTVVVEILCSFCLMSVLPNYSLYKKYNIAELCGSGAKKEKKDMAQCEKKEENETD